MIHVRSGMTKHLKGRDHLGDFKATLGIRICNRCGSPEEQGRDCNCEMAGSERLPDQQLAAQLVQKLAGKKIEVEGKDRAVR